MKAKELTDIVVTDSETHRWLNSYAGKHIRAQRLRKWISKIFELVELKAQPVEVVVMDAADYSEMKKYLRREMDMETRAEVMKRGQFAIYCGARILIDRRAVEAVAYGPVPEGCVRVMLEEESV